MCAARIQATDSESENGDRRIIIRLAGPLDCVFGPNLDSEFFVVFSLRERTACAFLTMAASSVRR